MSKWFFVFGLFVLIACGQRDIDTGQQASPEPRLITVTGVPENFTGGTLEPIVTPIKVDGGWIIDAVQPRAPMPIVITMADTVTITLSRENISFDQEQYYLNYDPNEWSRLVDGKIIKDEDSVIGYPDGGWVLQPLYPTQEKFMAIVTLLISDEGPPDCETCLPNQDSRIYNFQIDPVK